MNRVQIIKDSDTGLAREVWTFWFHDSRDTLFLDSYAYEERASRRHKHKVVRFYDRMSHRQYPGRIQVHEVPLPEGLFEQAKVKFVEQIKVALWPQKGHP